MATTPQDRKKKRSGNPSTRAVSSAKAWKTGANGNGTSLLDLPSGNTVRVRQVGPEAFLSQGVIPESLLPKVLDLVDDKQGKRPRKKQASDEDVVKRLLGGEDGKGSGLYDMLLMMDRILAYAVVDPPVQMPPACESLVEGKICGQYNTPGVEVHRIRSHPHYHAYNAPEKEDDIVYSDEVSLEDKQEVMEFAMGGGTSDLEPFRGGSGATVASMDSGEGPEAITR